MIKRSSDCGSLGLSLALLNPRLSCIEQIPRNQYTYPAICLHGSIRGSYRHPSQFSAHATTRGSHYGSYPDPERLWSVTPNAPTHICELWQLKASSKSTRKFHIASAYSAIKISHSVQVVYERSCRYFHVKHRHVFIDDAGNEVHCAEQELPIWQSWLVCFGSHLGQTLAMESDKLNGTDPFDFQSQAK